MEYLIPRVINRYLVVVLFFLCDLIGCASRETKSYGGALRIGNFHKPTEINALTTDSSISANLLDMVFDTLIRIRSDGQVTPALAEKWEISPDGLVWTFHLKRTARFHDGEELDAYDVKFTFDTLMKTERRGNANILKYLKDVQVINQYVVQISLTKPDNLLKQSLNEIFIAPRHLLEGKKNFDDYNNHPIGSGPYRFLSREDDLIVLEANEKYFEGRPYLDRIVIVSLPTQQANLSHLIAGKIDMVFLINPEDYGALSGIPSIRVYDNWHPVFHLLALNLKNPLFSNSEVRKALNYAVNRQLIIDRVLNGKGKVDPFPYQPDLALQILLKQGWRLNKKLQLLEKGGKKFEFSTLSMEGHDLNVMTLQILQQQLREIGIKMNIETIPFDQYVDRVFRKRDFESNFIYQIFRPSYDSHFSFWHSSQIEGGMNFSSYSNPKADALLEEARLSTSEERRKAAQSEFQKVLHDDPPGIFLFWRDMPIAVHKRFRGFPEKRMESLRDLVNVWVPKGEQFDH